MNESAFLSALHESPDDEVTWLALADWLDEDGQSARAELVRLVRRLGALPPMQPTPERKDLQRRVAELLLAGVRPAVPELTNPLGMRFALIPAGRFRMGSPENEPGHHLDERAHEVQISRPYYLGVLPVTQRQYEAVMGHNPSFFRRGGEGADQVAGVDTADFPVETVSWNDAAAFCERLSETLGEIRAGRRYRLPTEAEWEHACRAGTDTAYCFGDELAGTQANFNGGPAASAERGPALGRPCPVGSYPANAWGLHDVHGNVYEWCSDVYHERTYEEGDRKDPQGPPTGEDHPLRGGSWYGRAVYCRSAWRDYNDDEARLYVNGFRVVMARR